MRFLTLLVLLNMSIGAFAQNDYPYKLRICPTDTTENIAKKMINDIEQYTAKEYQLVYVDSQRSRTVEHMYRNPQQEVLRIIYKYTNRDNGREVTYMSFWGEVGVITGIYNYIFQTDAMPQDAMSNMSIGTMLEYGGSGHQFMFEADDRRPGYWTISFVN